MFWSSPSRLRWLPQCSGVLEPCSHITSMYLGTGRQASGWHNLLESRGNTHVGTLTPSLKLLKLSASGSRNAGIGYSEKLSGLIMGFWASSQLCPHLNSRGVALPSKIPCWILSSSPLILLHNSSNVLGHSCVWEFYRSVRNPEDCAGC